MNSPTPPPFGDPSQVRSDNVSAIKKGIGCGCGGCGAIILAGIAFMMMIIMVVFYFMRSADGTQEAILRAKQNPEVIAVLGEPIETGWLITGKVNGTGVGSTVDVSIPLSGPKGSGRLMAKGLRERQEHWNFSTLRFSAEGSDHTIDLAPSK